MNDIDEQCTHPSTHHGRVCKAWRRDVAVDGVERVRDRRFDIQLHLVIQLVTKRVRYRDSRPVWARIRYGMCTTIYMRGNI